MRPAPFGNGRKGGPIDARKGVGGGRNLRGSQPLIRQLRSIALAQRRMDGVGAQPHGSMQRWRSWFETARIARSNVDQSMGTAAKRPETLYKSSVFGGRRFRPYPTDRVFYVAPARFGRGSSETHDGACRTRDRSPPARRRWSRSRSREGSSGGLGTVWMPSLVRTRSRVRRPGVRLSSASQPGSSALLDGCDRSRWSRRSVRR